MNGPAPARNPLPIVKTRTTLILWSQSDTYEKTNRMPCLYYNPSYPSPKAGRGNGKYHEDRRLGR